MVAVCFCSWVELKVIGTRSIAGYRVLKLNHTRNRAAFWRLDQF